MTTTGSQLVYSARKKLSLILKCPPVDIVPILNVLTIFLCNFFHKQMTDTEIIENRVIWKDGTWKGGKMWSNQLQKYIEIKEWNGKKFVPVEDDG